MPIADSAGGRRSVKQVTKSTVSRAILPHATGTIPVGVVNRKRDGTASMHNRARRFFTRLPARCAGAGIESAPHRLPRNNYAVSVEPASARIRTAAK
jgi:hypothetical protein